MQYGDMAFVYDALMYDMSYEKWAEYICNNLDNAQTVLELGCGTGSLTRLLAKKYDVCALDISDEMLDVARQKLLKQGISARLIQGDMRNISLHKKVDAVVCACDGINYLKTSECVMQAFLSVFNNLNDGGKFIFDISSPNKLIAYDNVLYSEDSDEATYIWRNKVEKDLLTMDITFFVPEDDINYTRFDETHVQRMHREEEIVAWLKEAGFKVVSVTDDYSDNPVNEQTGRITFIAQK